MLHKIKAVEYLEGYKLKLWFDNDCIKIADLENKLKNAKNMFLPLQQKSYFKQVFLDEEAETICWPNGLDLCPDTLFHESFEFSAPTKKPKATSPRKKVPAIHKKRATKHVL